MNRADVIRLAREAGFRTGTYDAVALQFVHPAGENCLVEVERLIELAQAEVRKEIDAAHQQAIAAAVLVEREAIAQWYAIDGWLMDESDIAGAIRARTQPAPTGAKKEDGHDRTT